MFLGYVSFLLFFLYPDGVSFICDRKALLNSFMGILEFCGGDPLDADQWKKQPYPALCAEDGWNGPGHCSVVADEKKDYIAFHVYDEGKTEGWSFVHAVIFPFEIIDGKIQITDNVL